ncbi:MAG: M20/M25/M40 family metallo-hydrolase [Chloroflexota bacterium]
MVLGNFWKSPAIAFHPDCVTIMETAVSHTNSSALHLISGAGHDAVYINRIAPTSMIFIPRKGCLSHNELEDANKEDVIAGRNVLLQTMLVASQIFKHSQTSPSLQQMCYYGRQAYILED